MGMVLPGADCPTKADPATVAKFTVQTLQRTVPPAIPGIMFLSGGQSEEDATVNLNAINALDAVKPWSLSFSYGRALQATVIKTWDGKKENVKAAQEAFLRRAKANSEAQWGKYAGGMSEGKDSLYVKDYKY